MSDEKPKSESGHLADIGAVRRRLPPKAKGILDQLGAEEVLPQVTEHRIMPNDPVSFLGGVYYAVRVDLEKDTVSFYIGDELRTYPRSMVSKVKSCINEKAPTRRKR